jgi:hypothetical protein
MGKRDGGRDRKGRENNKRMEKRTSEVEWAGSKRTAGQQKDSRPVDQDRLEEREKASISRRK